MKRLTMRKIKEAMRLHANGLSMRKIAASLGVGHSTAIDYMKRIRLAGLTWPLPTDMTDATLEALLFHPIGGPSRLVEAQPDWPMVHCELRRPGVTLSLLWEEYRAAHPEGYGYSRFCDLSPVGRAADAGDAPAPYRRGAGFCRLCGHNSASH